MNQLANRVEWAAARGSAETALQGLLPAEWAQVQATATAAAEDADPAVRADAFAVLYALARACRRTQASACQELLVRMVEREAVSSSAAHMVRALDRPDFFRALPSVRQRRIDAVRARLFPERFDVGNILSADGYVQWDNIVQTGEGRLRSLLVWMSSMDIHGARFVRVDGGPATDSAAFELTFPQPRGANGRIRGIRVRVFPFEFDNMFQDLDERRGFAYFGHSQSGLAQERSLAAALHQRTRATSPTIGLITACGALDNLNDNQHALGDITWVMTAGPSYYQPNTMEDELGQFDGISMSEGIANLQQFFEGLTNEESFHQLNQRFAAAEAHFGGTTDTHHLRQPNLIAPSPGERPFLATKTDTDLDGIADAVDVRAQSGSAPGKRFHDAVLDLNTALHYNPVLKFGLPNRFVGLGVVQGDGTVEFRVVAHPHEPGERLIGVTISERLASLPRSALRAVLSYEAVMWLTRTRQLGLSEAEAKTLGLLQALAQLQADELPDPSDARVVHELVVATGLPAGLPWQALGARLANEHDLAAAESRRANHTGDMRMVQEFLAQLPPRMRAALDDPRAGSIQ